MTAPPEWRIDPGQWDQAIAASDGPQIVVAGPGAGKTEFLVRRATHLIREVVDRGDQVVILTFSRRAAADLRRRVADAVDRSITAIASSTFHSFASRLLETAGKPQNILTGPEQVALVADLLAVEDPADWPPNLRSLLTTSTFAVDTTDFILRCLERLIDPEELGRRAAARPRWRPLPQFFRAYQLELDRRDRTDYGSLLTMAVKELDDPELRRLIGIRYVIIDEYQDTSPAQAALADRLTKDHRNLTVAADPYQSVYSFRGASLDNVAQFPNRFLSADGFPARRIVLTESFRVPAPILESALRITGPGELPGATGPVRPAPHSGSVEAYVFDQASAEAEWIASEVETLHLIDRIPYSNIAVLLRSKRRLLPELSRALSRRAIPHHQPDVRLVDHPAVQAIFDLGRVATLISSGRVGDELDGLIRRILLGFLHRIPISREREIHRIKLRGSHDWPQVLAENIENGRALATLISDATWATRSSALEGFWHAWSSLPQFEAIVADPELASYRAAWSSFAQALARQAERDPAMSLVEYHRTTLEEDFEATPLLGFAVPNRDVLTLTTLHQAKGLEFEVVFIADAVESVFPDLRRGLSLLDQQALSDLGTDYSRFRLQEEMRLAYSAMTKARSRVVWTATSATADEGAGRPSRFMLAAAGVDSVKELNKPGLGDRPPLTPGQAESALRRTVADPATTAASRLAALAVLTTDPASMWNARTFAGTRSAGPDAGLIDDRITLSPSQAESYLSCPRQYVLERRIRVGETKSVYARFGSVVHATLELCEKRSLEVGRRHADLREASAALDEVWAGSESGSLGDVWKRKAVALIERLWAEWPADSLDPIALEKRLELDLDGVAWVGRADRIERLPDGGVRVVDYKTSKTASSYESAGGSTQLGFYMMAVQADPEISAIGPVVEAEFWYPASTAKGWRRPFDPQRLPEVREVLIGVGTAIKSEDWTPRLGDGCRYCTVRGVCPLWPEGKEAFAQ